MNDPGDLVLVESLPQRRGVGDVPAYERDAGAGVLQHEREA